MVNEDNVLKMFSKEEMGFISREEEVGLFKRLDRAGRERLLNSHIRLVVKLAREYSGYGVDLEDLVSEGCIGLFRAIDRFDHTKGTRFSFYCVFWIKQAIVKALADQSRAIRLPTGATIEYLKILKFIKRYREAHAGEPSAQEIAESVDISANRVSYILAATEACISIHALVNGLEDTAVYETIQDYRMVSPSTGAESADDVKMLRRFFNKLNKREQVVLSHRFGLFSNDEQTLAEIGGTLNLTRERVRQIEEESLLKLKNMLKKEQRA